MTQKALLTTAELALLGISVERLYEPSIASQIESLTRLLAEAMGRRPSGGAKLEVDGVRMAAGGARHGERECSEASAKVQPQGAT